MAGRATLMKDGGRGKAKAPKALKAKKPSKRLLPAKAKPVSQSARALKSVRKLQVKGGIKRSPSQKRLTNAGLHMKGQSSKKAVRKVTKKVQARSGRNFKTAKAQARRIVRKRKAGTREAGDT
jgi:hypothetical protein